ncbi:NUDIX hydrolase [Aspergillus affinis]|uniref:NUDIX hydrolase n=1 Tax=Aspergillus affinis TaxID=1070780 RepID=UPI0022FE4753|nr:uncharacterized protein KD926_003940 [Aspergillus affinis]KAI9046102.1 hypothetical protein KD926_003940 [Aspergillus affinis]
MASSINSTSVPSGMLPHDPSAAARNVTGGLFDLDSETDLSAFRIAEPPCRFRFRGTTYRIRVSARVFSWLDDNHNETTDSPKPRLLLQRALCDTQSGCWEVAGGGVEKQDQSPRNALTREVQEENGLLLSVVAHALPVQTWRKSKGEEWHEWVGLPYIIEVSRQHATSQYVPQPVGWENAIRLDPEEHQAFT